MGAMVVMRWFVGFYRGLLIGLEQQVWLNVYRIIIATFRFIGAFLLIKYCTDNILYFFLYQLIVGLAEYLIIILKSYSTLPKTKFCLPHISPLLKIAPFALSIAYTSSVWIIFSQVDKLLLSHYIPLKEYGYFTLVTVIAGGIMQLSAPLSQAILPRMTHLLAKNKQQEMLKIYKQGTQIIAVVIFSTVAIIALFSQELLYAWTGDINAAKWAAPVLFWYLLGNGILSVLAFQYYLQYAHGNLRYHVRFNIFFPLAVLPIIYFNIIHYGAIGAGMTLFFSQLIAFVFWPMFIHRKFAPGIHLNWMLKDIGPALLISILYSMVLHLLPINFNAMSRVGILMLLITFGAMLLGIQLLFYPQLRVFRINYRRLNESKKTSQ
jgi:O-antigen/teichoic acid export membrane protein